MQATFDLLFGAGGNSNAKLRYKTFKVQFPNLIKKNPEFHPNFNRMLAVTLIHHIIQNNPPGQRLDSVGPVLLSALTKLG